MNRVDWGVEGINMAGMSTTMLLGLLSLRSCRRGIPGWLLEYVVQMHLGCTNWGVVMAVNSAVPGWMLVNGPKRRSVMGMTMNGLTVHIVSLLGVVVVFVTRVGKIQGTGIRGVMPDDMLVADFVVIIVYTILVTKVVGSRADRDLFGLPEDRLQIHLGRANSRIVMAVDCTVLGWMLVHSLRRAVLRTLSVDGLVIHVVSFLIEVLVLVLVLVQMEILMRGVVGCDWVDLMSRGVEGFDMVTLGTTGR